MLSRKEFFKDLLHRALRALNDAAAADAGGSDAHAAPASGDLPVTELSPALLAVEAELRGLRLPPGGVGELQRQIHQELAQNRPPPAAEKAR